MSDSLRKGFGEQAAEKVTPQSQKTYGETISENVTGVTDKLFGSVQGNKSTTQEVGDKVRGTGDDAQSTGGSLFESTKQTATDGVNSASETLGNLTGSAKGKTEDVTKQ